MRRSGCAVANSYTLEAILTPDGNVVYQYQTLTGTINSATIGIENGAGNVALQAHLNGTGWVLAANKAIRFNYPAGDHTGPTIVHTPLLDTELPGPWTVSATVTDDSGVISATLNYRLNGGAYTAVPMTAAGSTYSALIPDQTGIIDYYISAADAVSPPNNSTSPTWTFSRRPVSGGPDSFGYTWANSHAPAGPVHSWEDITTNPAAVALTPGDDTYSAAIPMGFGFPYYDAVKTSLKVSSNGFITFGAGTSNGYGQALPSVGEPNDVIAAFWDDLNSASATAPGSITYLNDAANGRFIVQWHTVAYGGSLYFDFQIVLHASGDITMHYLNVNEADVALSTTGIENATGTVGLQVRRNSLGSALTDAFSIFFDRPAGDVVGPGIVHTPLGNTEDTVNAYTVNATITDSESPMGIVSLNYRVNGGSYSSVSMTGGPVYTGQIPAQAAGSAIDYYILASDGAVPPNFSTSSTWTFHVVDYTLAPTGLTASDGNLDQVVLSWTAPAWIPALSSAPQPRFEDFLPLFESKDAAFEAYSAALLTWEASRQNMDRSFQGYNIYRDGSLIGTSATTTYTDVPATTAVFSYHVTALFSGGESLASTSDTGFMSLRPTTGGPDTFGYTWINSLDADGPAFEWIDISTTGTALVLADDASSAALPLGFAFTFYGVDKNEVFVGSNGLLTFGAGSTAFSNTFLPSAVTPNDVIAPFWDDFNPSLVGSTVHYLSDVSNDRFIVQYHVPAYGATAPYIFFDFQVVLQGNGNIRVNLLNVNEADVVEATLGIEDAFGLDGLSANFNNVGGRLADGVSYLFIEPGNIVVGADETPTAFGLLKAWPNPFNPTTQLSFQLPETAQATVRLLDIAGRQVAVLASGVMERGEHQLTVDASSLASGMYFAQVESQGHMAVIKLSLVR